MIDTDYILDPMLADDCDPDEEGWYHVELSTHPYKDIAYWKNNQWQTDWTVLIWYDKKPKAII